MVRNHMKRVAAPKTWLIKRKEGKWVSKPSPGTHKLDKCVPLTLVVRDYLGYANTAKEVRSILHKKDITINNIFRNDAAFPVGLMDVVSVPSLKENYIILFNKKGKLVVRKIEKVEGRLIKLRNKSLVSGCKKQLNFNDGTNMLVDDFSKDHVGDSYIVDLESKKIKHIIHLAKGSLVYFIEGTNIGKIGKIKEHNGKIINCDIEGNEYECNVSKILVIDDHYKKMIEDIDR